jgi:predicted glycogen debranching enzyme
MHVDGARQAFTVNRQTLPEVIYPVEESRGYEETGTLWSPGYFRADLSQQQPVCLVASTEPWEVVTALRADEALGLEYERRKRALAAAPESTRHSMGGELVLAADQFIIKPVGRTSDSARAGAEGDDLRTIIAGYHWFTDWGRDTMISLEGLTLMTGRHAETGYTLRLFAHYLRDGLLPNLFPEGDQKGLYHTADATLWFFHAIGRYLDATDDRATLDVLLPHLLTIVKHHLDGTRFGIGVDPQDGLLRQGEEGYQLTWMDAKVDDWVVTPRRGKAVEINALWYNALGLLAGWVRQVRGDHEAKQWEAHAEETRVSFNRRFWYEQGGYLFDVVDGEQGDDTACRPNQLLAISLAHPVLDRRYRVS